MLRAAAAAFAAANTTLSFCTAEHARPSRSPNAYRSDVQCCGQISLRPGQRIENRAFSIIRTSSSPCSDFFLKGASGFDGCAPTPAIFLQLSEISAPTPPRRRCQRWRRACAPPPPPGGWRR
eukprot:scaffold15803_cov74-Phaeocystis_antarctica.AAC.2